MPRIVHIALPRDVVRSGRSTLLAGPTKPSACKVTAHARSSKGRGDVELDNGIRLTTVPDHARCACGEPLAAGERAGLHEDQAEFVCLWCLADLKAGRARPRRRPTRAPASAKTSAALPPVRGMPRGRLGRSRSRPGQRRRRRRAGAPRTGVTLLIVLAVLVGAAYVDNAVLGHDSFLKVVGLNQLPGVPSHGLDRNVPPGTDSTDYAFIATRRPSGNDPVTWSSCKQIHLVVNEAAAPPQAARMLREALDRVSELSGLEFVVDGPTDEPPVKDRPAQNLNPLKGRWRPALVAWTTPEVAPELAGPVAGVGGPREAPSSYPEGRHFVSGIVYLDGPAISEVLKRRNGWAQSRAIVMHEVGHMVGLGHVAEPTELMAEKNTSGVTDFGPGDRAGLSKLGSGPCFR